MRSTRREAISMRGGRESGLPFYRRGSPSWKAARLPHRIPGLWVQIGSERRRLTLTEIRWIEAERDYVRVHMDGHSHLVNVRCSEK
jgi:hypothetical protein